MFEHLGAALHAKMASVIGNEESTHMDELNNLLQKHSALFRSLKDVYTNINHSKVLSNDDVLNAGNNKLSVLHFRHCHSVTLYLLI